MGTEFFLRTAAYDRLVAENAELTARAERAEAALRDANKTVEQLMANEWPRVRRAEAAIERVRALCAAREYDVCVDVLITDVLAALDSTDPVEAAFVEWREVLDSTHPDTPAPGRHDSPNCACGTNDVRPAVRRPDLPGALMPKRNPATGDPILDTLRAERERRGLSQTELARTIGRSTYQTTYQWESGATSPTLRCLREWAASLGYEITLTRSDSGLPVDGEERK